MSLFRRISVVVSLVVLLAIYWKISQPDFSSTIELMAPEYPLITATLGVALIALTVAVFWLVRRALLRD